MIKSFKVKSTEDLGLAAYLCGCLLSSFQRVVSANRADELRRAERRKALEEESREALSALRAKCEEKQKRAEFRLSTIALDKEHNLKGQR